MVFGATTAQVTKISLWIERRTLDALVGLRGYVSGKESADEGVPALYLSIELL